jgi:osmotically-inducible protein OsmY
MLLAAGCVTANVKALFADDLIVGAMQVEIETRRRVVELGGFAETKEQAERAGEIACTFTTVET